MRLVTAWKEHVCQKCGQRIREGDKCFQSEAFYGAFWHYACYDHSLFEFFSNDEEDKPKKTKILEQKEKVEFT